MYNIRAVTLCRNCKDILDTCGHNGNMITNVSPTQIRCKTHGKSVFTIIILQKYCRCAEMTNRRF